MREPCVFLVGTPIGNLQDIAPRAVEALREADIIACEDTRRTQALLTHLGITRKSLVALHADNEFVRAPQLVKRAKAETLHIVVVSDSGMPAVSDPGQAIVNAAHNENVLVSIIPGPSAVVAAVAASGFPGASFRFEGFLPSKKAKRMRIIDEIHRSSITSVFYEAPHRLTATVAELAERCGGERRVLFAREMTKVHEEVLRTTLGELAARLARGSVKGECVLVIEGAKEEGAQIPDTALLEAIARETAMGLTKRDVIRSVSVEFAVNRNRVAKLIFPPNEGSANG